MGISIHQDGERATVVITGATSGIGLAAVELLAERGLHVIGVGRSAERCRQAAQRLSRAYPQARVEYCVADLALQSQVRTLAAEIRTRLAAIGKTSLDGLVNNAGTFTYWMALTPEGFETQWAVNHLAPFLLTLELLPLLRAAPAARIVTVSSDSHYHTRLNWNDLQLRRRYNGLLAYKQTKLANVLFSAELNRRLGAGASVRAFVADPGLVQTDIGLKATPGLAGWVWKIRRAGGISALESAQGVVYLLMEPSVGEQPHLYWKHSRPKKASSTALDPQPAGRLWAISAQMCGLPVETPL